MAQRPEHDASASAIKQLAQCPEAYFKNYVAKDPRRNDRGAAANAGILVHDALARAVKAGLAEISARDLLSFLEAPLALDAEPQLVAARLDAAAVAAARGMARDAAREVDPSRVAVEHGRALAEERVTFDVGGTRVLVILDRVDAPGAGTRVAVDYKTGADLLDRDDMRLDPQALLQAAAMHDRYPAQRVSVEFHWLTRGVVVPLVWDEEVDAFARQLVRDHVAAVAWHSKRAKWPARPSSRHCGGCPFRANCQGYLAALASRAVVDTSEPADLAATVAGFHAATDAAKLWEDRKRDLAEPLRATLEERGEFPMAGRRVRMGKRAAPKFNDPRATLRRAAEAVGRALGGGADPAPADLERWTAELEAETLSLSTGKLREHVEALPLTKGQKRAINEAINDTGTLDVATWVETRALPDPFAGALEEDSTVPESVPAAPGAAGLGGTVAAAPTQPAAPPPSSSGPTPMQRALLGVAAGVADGAQTYEQGLEQATKLMGVYSPENMRVARIETTGVHEPPVREASMGKLHEPPAREPDGQAPPRGYCSSCGAEIVWGKTLSGKRCPFNLDAEGASHFTTCVNAAQHSRRKRVEKCDQDVPGFMAAGEPVRCTLAHGHEGAHALVKRGRKPKPHPEEKPLLAAPALDGAPGGGAAQGGATAVAALAEARPAAGQPAPPAPPAALTVAEHGDPFGFRS